MDTKFFLIIVTYNGLKWIDKCLHSCRDFPVVVVDNNSSDNTVDFIKQKYPNVYLIEQEKNLGFGQANNIGISYAIEHGAEYVFLLNQDAYLVDDCLQKSIRIHQKNPEFGILSPVHLDGKGTRLDFKFSKYLLKNQYFYSDHVLSKPLDKIYEVPFVNAAGWLISKKCLLEVGGFDPIFFHYGEDDNYCHRVKYHNLKIGVIPDGFIKHDRNQTDLKKVDDLILTERLYKLEYANPAKEDFEEQFSKKVYLLRRSIIKNKLMLRSARVKQLDKYLKMLERIRTEIAYSRKITQKVGPHFLKYL